MRCTKAIVCCLFFILAFNRLRAQSQARATVSVTLVKYVGANYLDRLDFETGGGGKLLVPGSAILIELTENNSDTNLGAQVRFKVISEPFSYSISTEAEPGRAKTAAGPTGKIQLFAETIGQSEQVYSLVSMEENGYKQQQPEAFPVVINVN